MKRDRSMLNFPVQNLYDNCKEPCYNEQPTLVAISKKKYFLVQKTVKHWHSNSSVFQCGKQTVDFKANR